MIIEQQANFALNFEHRNFADVFMLKQQHYTLKLKKWKHNQGPL